MEYYQSARDNVCVFFNIYVVFCPVQANASHCYSSIAVVVCSKQSMQMHEHLAGAAFRMRHTEMQQQKQQQQYKQTLMSQRANNISLSTRRFYFTHTKYTGFA